MARTIRFVGKALFFLMALGLSGEIFAQSSMSMGGAAAPKGAGSPMEAALRFREEWKAARGAMKFNPAQLERLRTHLKDASFRLAGNWESLESLRAREGMAKGDELASLKKRLAIALAERDLIVSEIETSLRDFLTGEQLSLVMSAAFHGVSASHSGDMPMEQAGGGMAPMSSSGDLEMRLADQAGMLNEGSRAVSIDELLKDLADR